VQRFGSKRGLLLALAARAPQALAEAFRRACETDHSPLAALQAVLVGMVQDIDSPAVMANHVALLHQDLRDADFRLHAQAHAAAFRAGIARLLTAAQAANELQPLDAESVARAVQLVYNGTLVSWAIEAAGESLAERLKTEVERLLEPYRAIPNA
jgi:AcrR family transcriptional regulator